MTLRAKDVTNFYDNNLIGSSCGRLDPYIQSCVTVATLTNSILYAC